jgi:dienelactone hydrolase
MSNPTALDAVVIQDGAAELHGDLLVPPGASGLVIFAHGSGSSRFSRRNREVAAALQSAGLGTLLLDLLTRDEERVDNVTCEFRFDIPRLGRRVTAAADWATAFHATAGLPLGYFGASTGAAAALIAAAERPGVTRAVVSRGGRPDLAGGALERVEAPTLLIVGGDDEPVIEMNEQARVRMRADVQLTIIPGATHLFEEPGAMEEVSRRASEWFSRHFAAGFR